MTSGLIIDIAIGAVTAIAVIIGLVRGFSKQFSKTLCKVIALVCSIMLIVTVFPLIDNSGILNAPTASAGAWFKGELYSREITDVDGLSKALSENYLSILAGSADKMFKNMTASLSSTSLPITIGNYFGKLIVSFISELLLWTIFYLAIKYLLYGIKYLLGKITEVAVLKSIDKILGMLWAIGWTYIIVIGVILTAVELVVTYVIPSGKSFIIDCLSDSTLLQFLHNTNILGSFIANLFNLSLISI